MRALLIARGRAFRVINSSSCFPLVRGHEESCSHGSDHSLLPNKQMLLLLCTHHFCLPTKTSHPRGSTSGMELQWRKLLIENHTHIACKVRAVTVKKKAYKRLENVLFLFNSIILLFK